MIFFPIACNDGGMLRVTEALMTFIRETPGLPIDCVVMSEKKPHFLDGLDVPWIEWSDQLTLDDPKMTQIQNRVEELYHKKKYDWVIFDIMTGFFLRNIHDAKFCYDVHFLCRPFYRSLAHQCNLQSTTELFGVGYSFIHEMAELASVRHETNFIRKASAFISNSESTTRSLRTDYVDCVGDKPIFQVPVSSEIRSTRKEVAGDYLLYNGRFHVQKGLHHLVHHRWTTPLIMRGYSRKMKVKDETLSYLSQQNISITPFDPDNSATANILSGARAVLFPSIYEPWGLSLQEALSMGKLCIANFSHSGHEEQIENGVNGFLVDFSRPDLVSEVDRILSLPQEQLAAISLNARQRTTTGHTQRMDKLLETVVKLLSL